MAGAPVIISLDLPCRVYVYTKPAGGWVNMTQTAELSAKGRPADLIWRRSGCCRRYPRDFGYTQKPRYLCIR